MKPNQTLSTYLLPTPIGELFIAVNEARALVRLQFTRDITRDELEEQLRNDGHELKRVKAHCAEVIRQLKEYFRGKRRHFELELAPEGTPFQKKVWKALVRIPYGETWSYAQIARAVKSPRAVRAVGRCNALNPIVLVVPCHRVIGSDGSLTGYGGGLEAKELLLGIESCASV